MTIQELKKRGLKQGDLYFLEHKDKIFTGWYLLIANHSAISLNTELKGAHGTSCIEYCGYEMKKVIFKEDLIKNAIFQTSEFFKTFNESLVIRVITNIINKPMAQCIHAVHFGSTKLYTWRVPERLSRVNFKPGDIVEVETMYGKQYVQVRETAEYEYDEKTKEVLNLIKTDEIPF